MNETATPTPAVSPVPSDAQPEPAPVPAPQPQKSRKIFWPVLGIIGLLLIAGACIASIVVIKNTGVKPETSSQITPTPVVFQARVTYLVGNAWKIVESRRMEIREGDELTQGDELITDPNTRLVLTLDDGSVIRIDENSKAILSELTPSSIVLSNEKGIVFLRVIKDAKHTFAVKAKNYTVTSMGTAFSVENEDELKIKVYESTVSIKENASFAASGSGEVEVKENQQWQEKKKTAEALSGSEVTKNTFLAWSVKEDNIVTPKPTAKPIEEKTETKTESKTSNSAGTGTITLTGNAQGEGIALSWQVSGDLNVASGFKIVKATSENPVYPGDPYQYLSSSGTRSYTWSLKDGQTWHFRVCQYINGVCGVYSNDVALKAPSGGESTSTQVKAISLTAEKSESNKVSLSWNVDGNSPLGFKVVWSKNSGPVYPSRDGDQYHYYSESGKRSDEVSSLDGGTTYYFRVCEYLGGKCGLYSNEVSIGL
jgi:hypothetical protein